MSRQVRVLLVDDEATQREMLASHLKEEGYVVVLAADGEAAIRALAEEQVDLVLTDQRMPKVDGLQLLAHVRRISPDTPVVLMTAYGSVSQAVDAIKEGATDYLCKPFEPDELSIVLRKALRQRRLEAEVDALHGALRDRYRLGNLIGKSSGMQAVFSMIERVSDSDVPVLIRGESGTGKELVARAIHMNGPRADKPFVAVNCAAIPEHLLESEFFGHERGAFTGADRNRQGRFEEANGGTLLLDEIGSMRVDLQAKLLRVLQEKEVQKLGARGAIPVDVRVLAATGENLEEAIKGKTFREDLFYRLNVVPIEIPPLRQRPEDIPLLVHCFLERATERLDRGPIAIAPEALDRLTRHAWPGNVRELESCIERMALLSRAPRLTVDDLPSQVLGRAGSATGVVLPPEGLSLDALERDLIAQALSRTDGVLGPAAELLGISYKKLQYRIQKHGLDKPRRQSTDGDT